MSVLFAERAGGDRCRARPARRAPDASDAMVVFSPTDGSSGAYRYRMGRGASLGPMNPPFFTRDFLDSSPHAAPVERWEPQSESGLHRCQRSPPSPVEIGGRNRCHFCSPGRNRRGSARPVRGFRSPSCTSRAPRYCKSPAPSPRVDAALSGTHHLAQWDASCRARFSESRPSPGLSQLRIDKIDVLLLLIGGVEKSRIIVGRIGKQYPGLSPRRHLVR